MTKKAIDKIARECKSYDGTAMTDGFFIADKTGDCGCYYSTNSHVCGVHIWTRWSVHSLKLIRECVAEAFGII